MLESLILYFLCSVFEKDRWTEGRNLDWRNVRIFNFVGFLCPVFKEALQWRQKSGLPPPHFFFFFFLLFPPLHCHWYMGSSYHSILRKSSRGDCVYVVRQVFTKLALANIGIKRFEAKTCLDLFYVMYFLSLSLSFSVSVCLSVSPSVWLTVSCCLVCLPLIKWIIWNLISSFVVDFVWQDDCPVWLTGRSVVCPEVTLCGWHGDLLSVLRWPCVVDRAICCLSWGDPVQLTWRSVVCPEVTPCGWQDDLLSVLRWPYVVDRDDLLSVLRWPRVVDRGDLLSVLRWPTLCSRQNDDPVQ